MSQLVLYSYWRSSCSYRVRIALNLKGLEYEYRGIHLIRDGGEQNRVSYLELNPSGQVPCLVYRDKALAQSMAIVLFLERHRPDPPLFPQDPWDAAQVVQLCEMVNAGIQPIQNLKVLSTIDRLFNVGETGKSAWVRDWVDSGFRALEAKLSKTAGRYCFGDSLTAADLFLVPQVYNADRFQLDMTEFPTIRRINETCLALEAFRKAAPEVQPDAPKIP